MDYLFLGYLMVSGYIGMVGLGMRFSPQFLIHYFRVIQ